MTTLTTVRFVFGFEKGREEIRARADDDTLMAYHVNARPIGRRTLDLELREFNERDDRAYIKATWPDVTSIVVLKPDQTAP